MDFELYEEISKPLIIEGFPGFGLVSTIAMEFLIGHMNTRQVGKVFSSKLPPMVAIHDGKIIEPIAIYYNPDFNIIFIYSMLNPKGLEWSLAKLVLDIAVKTDARGILSLEGISKVTETGDKSFTFSVKSSSEEKLKSLGLESLKEGIIMGVTSSIISLNKDKPIDCVFVETTADVPDSMGAARIVELLDKFLGLNIDTTPLVETAKVFEEKLKKIMEHTKEAAKHNQEEEINYVG